MKPGNLRCIYGSGVQKPGPITIGLSLLSESQTSQFPPGAPRLISPGKRISVFACASGMTLGLIQPAVECVFGAGREGGVHLMPRLIKR